MKNGHDADTSAPPTLVAGSPIPEDAAHPKADPDFHLQARRALRESSLAVLIFLLLSWAATEGRLGWFSDTLADAQDKAYDALAKLENNFVSPLAPPPGTPQVIFVDIDEASVNTFNPGLYLFHRGLLADLVQKLSATHPRAIYIDLNLSMASQEPDLTRHGAARFPRSKGDQALYGLLTAPHDFPILLSQPALFGEPLARLGGALCWVTPEVITDSGDTVRRIPRRWQDGPYPAAEALFQAAQPGGFHCPKAQHAGEVPKNVYRTALYGEPIIFHRIPAANEAEYGWPGVSVIRAGDLLGPADLRPEAGTVVVIGRTDAGSQDLHNSTVGNVPGVELHLNALMTLLLYHHGVQAVHPLLSAGLAFLVMLLAILGAPLLSAFLTRQLERLGLKQKIGDLFEHPILWGLLYLAAFVAYRYTGRFLDFALPILSLEFSRLILSHQTNKLVRKTLKMAKVL
ncbi:hypothetical protein DKM44_12655 [Deinococcus irradiatisoli]|uniref:CHASE2 domain-containing protein n=1 Tax=Deinococcus irradiatisoli TaxID=2202254 RepID=A0A2Z3JFM9_9DEIO|nr:CHASE2 domain-containing protein [Deinococcus irradiatisoli]AWN23973.1 hypothetical protein DKM44_12655 [Deinococcus irradiatisoli]